MTNYNFRKPFSYFSLLMMFLSLFSCQKFLAERSDKKLATPRFEKDLQAILDDVAILNNQFPTGVGEVASDNIYLLDPDWSSIPVNDRIDYIWQKEPISSRYWNQPYRTILAANTVLDLLDIVEYTELQVRDQIEGAAYFFRGYTYLELAQIFAPPYHIDEANRELLGLVMRLSSDINQKSQRSSLEDTYSQIIKDLMKAAELLPDEIQAYPTRPNKAAAFGALARCFLSMGDYENAGYYANLSILSHPAILDYNDVSHKVFPFERFNEEVVFYARNLGYGSQAQNRAKIDTNLYKLYSDFDLRKKLFFEESANSLHTFVGDYNGSSGIDKFAGITSAEMYLIRMECAVHHGNYAEALRDLNHLLSHRYHSDHFVLYTELNPMDLKSKILEERRKELIFRGRRWSDLRRFSFQSDSVSISRDLNGETYNLTAEGLRTFAFQIPEEIISITGIPQN